MLANLSFYDEERGEWLIEGGAGFKARKSSFRSGAPTLKGHFVENAESSGVLQQRAGQVSRKKMNER